MVCTDGLANVGLGSVDESDAPAPAEGELGVIATAEAFYRRVGEFAASKGVTIDVLGCVCVCVDCQPRRQALHWYVVFGSIEGDGCNLEVLAVRSHRR